MDRAIERFLALAITQHYVASTGQASDLGVSARVLRRAAKRGVVRIERRGVWAIAGVPPTPWQPLMAALLAAGPRAVISHRSAAVVHGFHGLMADTPELSVAHGRPCRLAGVRVHQARHLAKRDVVIRHGLRVTSPIRTVIDLAPALGDYLLGRILDEGAISRVWTAEQVLGRLDRIGSQGRHGSGRLRSLLALRLNEGHPDSPLEQRVIRTLRPHVPTFKVHYADTFEGERIEMDLAWLDQKIDGEVDGLIVHNTPTKKKRDRRRADLLEKYGWKIVHFTAEMDDRTLLDQIAALLPHSRAPDPASTSRS